MDPQDAWCDQPALQLRTRAHPLPEARLFSSVQRMNVVTELANRDLPWFFGPRLARDGFRRRLHVSRRHGRATGRGAVPQRSARRLGAGRELPMYRNVPPVASLVLLLAPRTR